MNILLSREYHLEFYADGEKTGHHFEGWCICNSFGTRAAAQVELDLRHDGLCSISKYRITRTERWEDRVLKAEQNEALISDLTRSV